MNCIALWVRNVGRLAKSPSQKTYKSSFMVSLNKRGQVHVNHPMDTNLEEYYRVVKEIVIPDCKEVVPDKDYGERIEQVISYIHPGFPLCLNFLVEHMYRIVAPQEHQTEENLTKVRILRACCDLYYNMVGQIDDLSDNSSMRKGKPAWHTICEGGQWAGMYDSLAMGVMPFHILNKYFKNHPGYNHMIEIFGNGFLKMYIGQIIDLMAHKKELSVTKGDTGINPYKSGHLNVFQPICGLLYAGVMDENVLQKVPDVYIEFGNLSQVWDDFNDWYGSVSATGKPALDNVNGGKSWATVTAMQHFNSRQMSLFKECNLSNDPEKITAVKKLLDEIDLPQHYINHMREAYLRITPMIEAIPHTRVRKACYSHMESVIGDVCDPLPIL